MGKSTLAISAAHYLSQRGFFSAVCHVQVQSAVSLWKDVVDNLKKLVTIPSEARGEESENDEHDGGNNTESNDGAYGDRRDRVVDLEFLHKMKDVNVLLVLDGSEKLIDAGAAQVKQFRSLLKILLTHTNRTKIILTTSKNSVGRLTFVNESVLEMSPLTKVEVSNMLMMKAPILRRGFNNSEEFLRIISQHPALDFFNGNPYAVGLCCTLLQRLPVQERDLDKCLALFKKNNRHHKKLVAAGSPDGGEQQKGEADGGNDDDDEDGHDRETDDEDGPYTTSQRNDDIEISLLVDDIINIKGEDETSETDSNSDESEEMVARFRAESCNGTFVALPQAIMMRQMSGGGGRTLIGRLHTHSAD